MTAVTAFVLILAAAWIAGAAAVTAAALYFEFVEPRLLRRRLAREASNYLAHHDLSGGTDWRWR